MALDPGSGRGDDRGRKGDATQEEPNLIGPDERAFQLELTPPQLKIVHSALRSMLSDFGHDEPDVHRIIREVLDKLPDEQSIRLIDIGGRRRRTAGP